jgi:hypothetical protein
MEKTEININNFNVLYTKHFLDNGGTIEIIDVKKFTVFELRQENGKNTFLLKTYNTLTETSRQMTLEEMKLAIKIHDEWSETVYPNPSLNPNKELKYFNEVLDSLRKDAGLEKKDYTKTSALKTKKNLFYKNMGI